VTQNTEDPVGRSLEESWLGQNGIYTGRSSANAIAYVESQKTQRVRVPPATGTRNRSGSGNPVGNLLAVIAIGLGIWVGLDSGSVLAGFLTVAGLSVVAGLISVVLLSVGNLFRWILNGGLFRAILALSKAAIGLAFWVGVILLVSHFSNGA